MAKDWHSLCSEPDSEYPIYTTEKCPVCGEGDVSGVDWGPVVCDICDKTEYECKCVPDIFHRE